ncbi:endonuclease VII domain-containing protein [Streptomyces sp. NBC_01716]|uniref:endonuclease VII domain-containing protein n=1 Tax=Streptomyces sp. NBC_01716 TaxID=2975917 RepID=UPI002E300C8E|nr:endonuclease VII domain-containing protein [Streptomyces sp. NBC_01716]
MTETLGLSEKPHRVCKRCRTAKPVAAFHSMGRGRRRPLCAPCRSETRPPEFRQGTPEEKYQGLLRREYGITLKQYRQMLATQGGGCAICGSPPSDKRRLAVDHCHSSGRVRALLCVPCNTQLGSFEKIRHLAVEYLARYGAGNPALGYDTASGTEVEEVA